MNQERAESPSWAWTSLLCYVPMAVGSIIWILWLDGPTALHERVVGAHPGMGAVLGFAGGLGIVLLSRGLSNAWSVARRMEQTFTRLLGPLTEHHCLWLAASSALGEELLFRAALQPLLGIVPTSLIFGLLHVPFERSLLLWTPFAIAMGFVLGWLYLYTGTLAAPVAMHFVINWLNLRRVRRLAGSLSVPY